MPGGWWSFSCLFFLLFSTYHHGNAANILANAILGKGSHFYLSAAIGEQLVHKGYNVTYLVSNAFIENIKQSRYGEMFNYEVFKHPIPVEDVHELYDQLNQLVPGQTSFIKELPVHMKNAEARMRDCETVLGDSKLLERFRRANFSAVLYDVTWPCGAAIAEILDLPYFVVGPFPGPCCQTVSAGSGCNPSYLPMLPSSSNKMSFFERVCNTLFSVLLKYAINMQFKSYMTLVTKFDDSRNEHVSNKAKLWLVNSDFVSEYPCPLPPNVIPVGGLTTRPPNPLSADLEEFVQSSADDGIIVCSFGSYLRIGDEHLNILQMLSEAFGRLPQKVIWQVKTPPPFALPQNVKILPWLPQNDLLGHPKTRAFFFHGGHNSYHEAIYHGIPTLILPICGDEGYVASRSVHFGLGLALDDSVTEDKIYNALYEITSNKTYTRTAKRLSAIFRDRPMAPAERAAFWVDHVIKHGGDYLQLPVNELNTFQYNLLDVIIFLVLVIALILYGLFKVFRLCCVSHRESNKMKSD